MSFFATKRYLERNLPEQAKQIISEVEALHPETIISVRAEQPRGYPLSARMVVLHGGVQPSHQWSYETAKEWLSCND